MKNRYFFAFALTLLLAGGFFYFQKNVKAQVQDQIYVEDSFDAQPDEPFVANDPAVLSGFEKIDSATSPKSTNKRPNIIFLMLDDTNPHDGRLWNKERTPAIYNNFISKGINFTNAFSETPLCCPGRSGFLTGQHTQNHNVKWNDGTIFNPSMTLATKLQSKGYYTMLSGKYLNDFNKIPLNKAVPPGWTKFDGIYAGNGKFYNYRILHKNGTTTSYGQNASDYSTDVMANYAVKRLKEAPADKPIFAYIAPVALHLPIEMAPRHRGDSRCSNISSWSTPATNEADVSDKPEYVRSLSGGNSSFNLKGRCEMMLSVDDLVRRIKFELDRQGRLQNTIFIFSADNGMSWGDHRLWAKTVPYSTRIPFYVSWTAGRGSTPRVDNTLISNIDLAPTLCDLAGCVMGPYPNGQQKPDGISILPLFKDQAFSSDRDAILEQMVNVDYSGQKNVRPGWKGLRTTEINPLGLWHYVEYENGEKELYDVSNGPCYKWTPDKGGDPCELNNLLRSDLVASSDILNIANILSQRLTLLKHEKGYTPVPLPTISLTPAPTLSPSIDPEPSL